MRGGSLPADRGRVLARTEALLRELSRQPRLRLTAATRLDEIAGLDSLCLMETVALLEAEFAVEVDTGALDRLTFAGDIVDAVLRALSPSSPPP